MNDVINNFFLTALKEQAQTNPEQPALIDMEGNILTYARLYALVLEMVAWLFSKGLRPDDTVIALLDNGIDTALVVLGCLALGVNYAPLARDTRDEEIMNWVKVTGAQFCLVPASDISSKHWPKQDVKRLYLVNARERSSAPSISTAYLKSGCFIMPSSGSTGQPKAILLSGDRLWFAALAFVRFHALEQRNYRFWNYLPMSYLGGLFNLLLIPLAAKGSIIIDKAFNGQSFLRFWPNVKRLEINVLWLVPTIARGLITLAKRSQPAIAEYPQIQHCFIGTAPTTLPEKDEFEVLFGCRPLENYGLTETTFISSEAKARKIFKDDSQLASGQVMPEVSIILKAVNGDTPNLTQLWVKTPYIMLGYMADGACHALETDEQGFWNTGDFVALTSNNEIQILGRGQDVIKKGGMTVLLRQIEYVAETYEGVAEAAAVKHKHAFYGESFRLYLTLKSPVADETRWLHRFKAWMRERLPQPRWADDVYLMKAFPRTASGKIQKHLFPTTEITVEDH